MYTWKKDIAHWKINNTIYISIPFTWNIPKAIKLSKTHKGKVYFGGPGAYLMKENLKKYGKIEKTIEFMEPILFHNPLATFTSRGCPNNCKFCAVPKIEGKFKELKNFRPAPVICDNNFLDSSKKHFNKVIDSLKNMPFVDFNQGLDAQLFKHFHADRISELKSIKMRFSFDNIKKENQLKKAIQLCKNKGLKNINCYVLIGFDDTPDEAIEKLEIIRSWNILPNPMRYQKLNCLKKNSYVNKEKGWNDFLMKKIMRYYSKLVWLGGVPFKEYKHTGFGLLNNTGFGLLE